MSDPFDTIGEEYTRIMSDRFIRRVDPELPVWEIGGSGPEYEQQSKLLLERFIRDHPRPVLRYLMDDADIETLNASADRKERKWRKVAPSLWMLPEWIDLNELYEFLWKKGWVLHQDEGRFTLRTMGFDEHRKRLVGMRYENIAAILQNDPWRDVWLLTVNPWYQAEEVSKRRRELPKFSPGLRTLSRLLGIWVVDEASKTSPEGDRLMDWTIELATPDERKSVITEGEGLFARLAASASAFAFMYAPFSIISSPRCYGSIAGELAFVGFNPPVL